MFLSIFDYLWTYCLCCTSLPSLQDLNNHQYNNVDINFSFCYIQIAKFSILRCKRVLSNFEACNVWSLSSSCFLYFFYYRGFLALLFGVVAFTWLPVLSWGLYLVIFVWLLLLLVFKLLWACKVASWCFSLCLVALKTIVFCVFVWLAKLKQSSIQQFRYWLFTLLYTDC